MAVAGGKSFDYTLGWRSNQIAAGPSKMQDLLRELASNPRLLAAIFSMVAVLATVAVIRAVAKLPPALIGPDLNMIGFGYAWDAIVSALAHQDYWPGYDWIIDKGIAVAFFALINFLLVLANMGVTRPDPQANEIGAGALFLSTVIGLPSAAFFVSAKAVWG